MALLNGVGLRPLQASRDGSSISHSWGKPQQPLEEPWLRNAPMATRSIDYQEAGGAFAVYIYFLWFLFDNLSHHRQGASRYILLICKAPYYTITQLLGSGLVQISDRMAIRSCDHGQ